MAHAPLNRSSTQTDYDNEIEYFRRLLETARRIQDPNSEKESDFEYCPQIVLCEDCRPRAKLLSSPKEFPIRVSGMNLGCCKAILWKKDLSKGYMNDNTVFVCCHSSLCLATAQPIRNVIDNTVKIARSWTDIS